jgi:hypothetical protein
MISLLIFFAFVKNHLLLVTILIQIVFISIFDLYTFENNRIATA